MLYQMNHVFVLCVRIAVALVDVFHCYGISAAGVDKFVYSMSHSNSFVSLL